MKNIKDIRKIFDTSDKQRYLTGALLILVLVLILSLNYKPLVWFILGILMLISVKESLTLYNLKSSLHFYICSALTWLGAYFINFESSEILYSPVYSGLFVIMLYASYIAYSKKLSLKAILPFIYPILPFLCIWAVYDWLDRLGLICLIVIVACTDTGAYFGGKIFGKTPFCPTSPKKTIEGVVIGLACGTIIGSIVCIGITYNFTSAVFVSLITALASVFGDLFESYLKREANLKDSGSIFPGHGGVLDRLDATLFGAVAMLFILSLLPLYQTLISSL